MRERWRAVDLEGEIVDVVVPPVLSWLVGLDERVIFGTKVRGRVPVRRVVTAADVSARHAHSQVEPLTADAKAVLASIATGRHVANLVEVTARRGHAKFLGES
jgi:hypothetical protein